MDIYLDQEFHEYFRKPIKWLPTIGNFNKPFHVIELISIGLVDSDNKEYYAVSKDFDITAAWNSFQIKREGHGDSSVFKKEYWLRENVLKPIFNKIMDEMSYPIWVEMDMSSKFNLFNFKRLINKIGISNTHIAKDVIEFTDYEELKAIRNGYGYLNNEIEEKYDLNEHGYHQPKFWGFYGDYDWVVFCSLFGKMINLPSGFPMYLRDLKQALDYSFSIDKNGLEWINLYFETNNEYPSGELLMYLLHNDKISDHPEYPKQSNEHIAIEDAKWNKRLHEFIKSL